MGLRSGENLTLTPMRERNGVGMAIQRAEEFTRANGIRTLHERTLRLLFLLSRAILGRWLPRSPRKAERFPPSFRHRDDRPAVVLLLRFVHDLGESLDEELVKYVWIDIRMQVAHDLGRLEREAV
jgi:hypothetical protein